MVFYHLWALFLLPVIPVLIYIVKKKDASAGVRFSSNKLVGTAPNTPRLILSRNLIYLRGIILILFVLALARPRFPMENATVETEGIDIVLAVDASSSMLAEDFTINGKRRNRLDVVKDVVEDFIQSRKADRIGMVAFAARAYTVCPLTLDYEWLISNLERVKIGAIEDGTAVGSAISSSVNRLKDNESKSKIVILLTDGRNNAGKITPLAAAEAAKAMGVKVYTIGAGKKGPVPYPARDAWGRTVYQNVEIDVDEDALKSIAEETGGRYYRATDTTSLKKIYDEIDSLEKTAITEEGFREYEELFAKFLIPALFLLILEIMLANTLLRRLP